MEENTYENKSLFSEFSDASQRIYYRLDGIDQDGKTIERVIENLKKLLKTLNEQHPVSIRGESYNPGYELDHSFYKTLSDMLIHIQE